MPFLCSQVEYTSGGKEHMRMVFYVSGSKRKGKAHLDLMKVIVIVILEYL